MDDKTTVALARAAAEAHTNLNTFHCVIGLLESGTIYGPRPERVVARIIAECRKAAAVELRAMDKAVEALNGKR